MSRKVYEIAFAIAGKMNSNFPSTLSIAEERIKGLRDESKKLSAEYKKGLIPLEQYTAKQASLTRQINETRRAQELMNRTSERAHTLASNAARAAAGSVRNTLTIGAGAVAVGGGFLLADSIKKSMDYEAQLASIQALTGINNDELKKMDDLALKMGQDTKYSALQAAQGIEELIKSGMSPATVQAGGLAASLNLATAANVDLAASAGYVTDALNGFKKDGMTAADVANILAGAANASSTEVPKIEEGLSAVGPVANSVGMSFKTLNATLADFSNHSLKGSDAGTSLKTFLQYIQPQTKETTRLFQKYGLIVNGNNVFFDQATGKLKDMADVAQILQDRFKNLNDQQRANAFVNIFGTDAQRAADILYESGSKGIKDMYSQMADVTALEVAKKKMDTAAGSVEQLRGTIETLQIRALKPTLPYIKKLADALATAVEKYTPAIVSGVQHGVDMASRYLHANFLDNPEFQRIPTISGKVEFIINSLEKTFQDWYATSGSTMVTNITSELTADMAAGIGASAGPITSAALSLGGSIASGIWDGLQQEIQKHPFLMMLFTTSAGALLGAQVGGPWGALIGAGAGAFGGGAAVLSASTDYDKKNKELGDFLTNLHSGDPNTPMFSGSGAIIAAPHASGGIFNRAHLGLVAEAGPEAIIPLNGSGRAKSLWATAGEKLGMGGGGGGTSVNITFAPVINGGNAAEIKPVLEEQRRSFEDQMSAWARQQRRLSFDG
jgi:TP901 family phage tail tape measure protein